MKKELLFVYNINGSLLAEALGGLQKIVTPKSYPCSLCKITYGTVRMKKEWKEFLNSLDYKISFLHKDEFRKEHPEEKYELPAIFVVKDKSLFKIVNASELNKQRTIEDLKNLVRAGLEKI